MSIAGAITTLSSTDAASSLEIDAKADAALDLFYKEVPAAKQLVLKSHGLLIFPSEGADVQSYT